METETLRTGLVSTKEFRSSDDSISDFDLPSIIAAMKLSFSWTNGELKSLILLRSPEKKIILTAMHEGTIIESNQFNDYIKFQVIEGRLKFRHKDSSVTLDEGQVMTFDENSKYSYTSLKDTVLLLTIADSISKVMNY
jgi:hypothetical protein